MPLYKIVTIRPTIRAYIWRVEESENELSEGVELIHECRERMTNMKSELHRRAFLSIRHLLSEAGYEDKDLHYNDTGKPHLVDGKHISITHSHNFTGIIIGEEAEVGIDIEKQRDKIVRIAHKYTPIEEYRTIANNEALVRKLTVVWGAKESLYKIVSIQGLSFLHHIDIMDFNLEDTALKGEITYQGNVSDYDISFLEFEGFTCVYALKC